MTRTHKEKPRGGGLPSYEDATGSSSQSNQGQASQESAADGPTLTSPFNFPLDNTVLTYLSSDVIEPPIAVPQIKSDATAPFLHAYCPTLLRHGITPENWRAFLDTMSGFLAATVSEKAISHAAEIARHVGDVSKRLGKDTLARIKATGTRIGDNAKKGHFLAATVGLLEGTIALSVGTSILIVQSVVSLPMAVVGAATRKPQTPKERAVAYAAAANVEWFHQRGLSVVLLDSAELSRLLGMTVSQLLETAHSAKDPSATCQLAALGKHIAELEIDTPATLQLEATTLWVVVVPTQGG
ncbi:hypothetical protein F4779DRAFT_585788 [Xylariaceae sp. FL0662B]|nr:hypothetical protein F4779DRAFT_585788 [Xylariaceae sp. FL0662B]